MSKLWDEELYRRERMTPVARAAETVMGMLGGVRRSAAQAEDIGAEFDVGRLEEWAKLCVPLDGEFPVKGEKHAEAMARLAARRKRLDDAGIRLFGFPGPTKCFCDGTGWERREGKFKSEKGHDAHGSYVLRCRVWPERNAHFWTIDPRDFTASTTAAVCPASVEWAHEMRRLREKKAQNRRMRTE